MELITTCLNCGNLFRWDDTFWKGVGMPNCPKCGFNNQTGQKGKEGEPIEQRYRKMARELSLKYGPLRYVEYLSHYPDFGINFVFEIHTVYSGRRRGEYDINFLSLGYIGEGPRYAKVFLDELGFSITSEEIEAIRPGAIIKLDKGKVIVQYNIGPRAKSLIKKNKENKNALTGLDEVEILCQELKDGHEDIRRSAAEALGDIGDKRAVEYLVQALKDKHEDVRWKSIEALGKIGDRKAIDSLKQALDDAFPFVQYEAKKALEKIKSKRN